MSKHVPRLAGIATLKRHRKLIQLVSRHAEGIKASRSESARTNGGSGIPATLRKGAMPCASLPTDLHTLSMQHLSSDKKNQGYSGRRGPGVLSRSGMAGRRAAIGIRHGMAPNPNQKSSSIYYYISAKVRFFIL